MAKKTTEKKTTTASERFDQLASLVVTRASAIKCSPAQYRAGVKAIINALKAEVANSKKRG
jgi:hypothetical protein